MKVWLATAQCDFNVTKSVECGLLNHLFPALVIHDIVV